MTRICLLALLITITSCASQQQTESKLASFVGARVQTAIEEFGSPSRVNDMQDGTWQYVWNKTSKSSTRAATSVFGVPVSKSFGGECSKVLVTDRRRLVISYHVLGRC